MPGPPLAPPPETLEGTVDKVFFSSGAGDFAAARLLTGSAAVTIRGPLGGLSAGMAVRVEGTWEEHARYGRQFSVSRWTWVTPRTAEGVERFLRESGIPGVGEKTARRIVAALGEEALERIDKDPGCLRAVKGLRKGVREAIARTWQKTRAGREALTFLYGLGLGPGLAGRIYKEWGSAAPALVREDPYRLCRAVEGIGFATADRIGRRLGVDAASPARIAAGLAHLLREGAGEGHVYLPDDILAAAGARLLGLPEPEVRAGLARLAEAPGFRVEALSDGRRAVYAEDLWRAEAELAEDIVARLSPAARSRSDRPPPALAAGGRFAPTPEQAAAIGTAWGAPLSVITGGPGVGKTAVIRALAEAAARAGVSCALAAPTGRAAKRVEELTGHRATTLHVLLRFDPRGGGFAFGRDRPLDAGLVVVDEASMLDLPLAWHLVQAVPPEASLVFVGDVDQLPSVGPGTFLRDLVSCGRVPVARLTRVFRQAAQSAIVANAYRINRGEFPLFEKGEGADCVFMERADPSAARDLAVRLCAEEIPRRLGLDPWTDVLLLSPMQKGEAGVVAANRALQGRLNPVAGGGIPCGDYILRPGDKVMQTQNNYDKGVFNGDIGRLLMWDAAEGRAIVRFGERQVVYEGSEIVQLTLAYACTVHKAQGAEFPAVVILLVDAHRVMLARNLLYTAVTRGRRLVAVVGSRAAVAAAVRNDRVKHRFSRLAERLREDRGG